MQYCATGREEEEEEPACSLIDVPVVDVLAEVVDDTSVEATEELGVVEGDGA